MSRVVFAQNGKPILSVGHILPSTVQKQIEYQTTYQIDGQYVESGFCLVPMYRYELGSQLGKRQVNCHHWLQTDRCLGVLFLVADKR